MQINNNQTSSWPILVDSAATSTPTPSCSCVNISKPLEAISSAINRLITNRAGLAYLAGKVLVPSQFLGPDLATSKQVIEAVCKNSNRNHPKFERFEISDDEGPLRGLICYPHNWNPTDRSRCVIYHNPNGITLPEYFENGRLDWTPHDILKIHNCPVILYDYLGTGLSQNPAPSSLPRIYPTYSTVVKDGEIAINYALKQFQQVDVWGSSLGGGVATIALESHLKRHPQDSQRVSITNHDSFSTTPRVVMPNWPRFADLLGAIVGAKIDATKAMQSLIDRGIKVTILCHTADPIIPKGARMADFVAALPPANNVMLIYSKEMEHAGLSADMLQRLRS